MVYEKVSSDMNFVDREKQVEKFWKDNDIFQRVQKRGLLWKRLRKMYLT